LIENSGGNIKDLSIAGQGSTELGTLPKSLSLVDANLSMANLKFTIAGNTAEIRTGSGDDTLTVNKGLTTIDTGDGRDSISISGGTNTVTTGAGDDTVSMTA
jgi:Ca2+-binding RTX toxin-like protein